MTIEAEYQRRQRVNEAEFYVQHGIEKQLEPIEFSLASIDCEGVFVMPELVDYWQRQAAGGRELPRPTVAVTTDEAGEERVLAVSGFEALEIANREGSESVAVDVLQLNDSDLSLIYDLRAHFAVSQTPSSFFVFLDSIKKSFAVSRWSDEFDLQTIVRANSGVPTYLSRNFIPETTIESAVLWYRERISFWGRPTALWSDLPKKEVLSADILEKTYLGEEDIRGLLSRLMAGYLTSLPTESDIHRKVFDKAVEMGLRQGQINAFIQKIRFMVHRGSPTDEILAAISAHTTLADRSAQMQQRYDTREPVDEVEELVKRARDTFDSEAIAELYAIYFQPIYQYIYYRVEDRELAEDLTMELFVKAMKNIASFTFSGARFSSWLNQIAKNLIIEHLRRQPNQPNLSLDERWGDSDMEGYERLKVSDAGATATALESEFTHQALRRALAELTDEQQQVIILKFVDGLSNREVAEVMGKTEGAVKSLQHRALATLGQILGESGDAPE